MQPAKDHKVLLVLWISSILLTVICFHNLSFYPNRSLANIGGDGIKNYFTYLYSIYYDSGVHFTGMNYPFGEHIVYTDNMPILSGGIRWLSNWFPNIKDYALGILNITILVSINLSSYYVFKILRKFGIANWFAVVSALFITFFSPQINKIYAHYGMSFVVMIPFVIYYLMEYRAGAKVKASIFIGIFTVIFTFLHMYNLAIIAFMIASYAIGVLIVDRKKPFLQKIKGLVPIGLTTGLNLIVGFSFLKLTDTIADRPNYPYGVLTGETNFSEIIFSSNRFGDLLALIFNFKSPLYSGEGYTYIGLVSIFALVIWLILFVYKKRKKLAFQLDTQYELWLWVALIHILFAMCIPLKFFRIFVSDHISIFRQFRTVGRFAWPFYYIIMIYVSILIYKLSVYYKQHIEKRKWATVLFSSVITIWAIQLYAYQRDRNEFFKTSLYFHSIFFPKYGATDYTKLLAEKGYKPKDFQAVLGLPFFHIGSEKIWIQDVDEGNTLSMLCNFCLQTGIPMMDVMMSRTSWSQTFELVNMVDGPFNDKKVLNKFDDRPLIVFHSKRFPLKDKEKEWLQSVSFLGVFDDDVDLYIMDMKAYKKRLSSQLAAYKTQISALPNPEGLLQNDTAFYYVNHFDQQPTQLHFIGQGAFQNPGDLDSVLVDEIIIPAHQDSLYNLTMWVKCNDYDYRSPNYFIHKYDQEGKLLEVVENNVKYSTNVHDLWFLTELDLKLAPEVRRISILYRVPFGKRTFLALDELLLRPEKEVYYNKRNKDTLLINNRIQP